MKSLSIEECLKGMNVMIKNASRLSKEAEKLERNNSPTANFLYTIAFEELGKCLLLGQCAIVLNENKKVNWKFIWKMFRSHKFKQQGLFQMILMGQKIMMKEYITLKEKKFEYLLTKEEIQKNIIDLEKEIADTKSGKVEAIKWKQLYADYINNGWYLPKRTKSHSFLNKTNIQSYIVDLKTMMKQIKIDKWHVATRGVIKP